MCKTQNPKCCDGHLSLLRRLGKPWLSVASWNIMWHAMTLPFEWGRAACKQLRDVSPWVALKGLLQLPLLCGHMDMCGEGKMFDEEIPGSSEVLRSSGFQISSEVSLNLCSSCEAACCQTCKGDMERQWKILILMFCFVSVKLKVQELTKWLVTCEQTDQKYGWIFPYSSRAKNDLWGFSQTFGASIGQPWNRLVGTVSKSCRLASGNPKEFDWSAAMYYCTKWVPTWAFLCK